MAHEVWLWLDASIVELRQLIQLNEEWTDQFLSRWLVVANLSCHFMPQLYFQGFCEQLFNFVCVAQVDLHEHSSIYIVGH